MGVNATMGQVLLLTISVMSLAACSFGTPLARQSYFETASAAKLAWQPAPNQPTSFQGCAWGSASYPCQPHTKLDVPVVSTHPSSPTLKSSVRAYKPIPHQSASSHTKTHHALPLCRPVTNSLVPTPTAITADTTSQIQSNPIANPRSSS